MLLSILKCKIHRALVTDKNIEYEGSITIDETLMTAAGLKPFEKVHVLDLNNGERFETYVIVGKKNTGAICVNGAAARLVEKGDKIIIVAYALMEESEAAAFKPKLVKVNEKNRIKK